MSNKVNNPCKECGNEFGSSCLSNCDSCYWEWFKDWDGTLQ